MKKRRKRHPLVQVVIPTRSLAPIAPVGGQSEIARLLRQIDTEYQAAQWGLSGLAQGTAQHEFITAKLERMEDARQELVQLVGDENEVTRLVVDQLAKSKEEGQGP
ncbi:MAG TPA: hypothetical protein VHV10_19655 [Ktedonobacteraceae bacterium]|nr:hypothetical protein [Ktedonobacteraceae bacterium]